MACFPFGKSRKLRTAFSYKNHLSASQLNTFRCDFPWLLFRLNFFSSVFHCSRKWERWKQCSRLFITEIYADGANLTSDPVTTSLLLCRRSTSSISYTFISKGSFTELPSDGRSTHWPPTFLLRDEVSGRGAGIRRRRWKPDESKIIKWLKLSKRKIVHSSLHSTLF